MEANELTEKEIKQAKKTRQKKGSEEIVLQNDVQTLMNTRQGRRMLFTILGFTGMNANGFNANNSHLTAFHAGQRQVGLDISDLIQRFSQEDYLKMLKEQMEDNSSE